MVSLCRPAGKGRAIALNLCHLPVSVQVPLQKSPSSGLGKHLQQELQRLLQQGDPNQLQTQQLSQTLPMVHSAANSL